MLQNGAEPLGNGEGSHARLPLLGEGDGAFVLSAPLSAAHLLREEAPAALTAYIGLLELFRNNLRYVLVEKKLDLPLFEKHVADVVDSLQRNPDVLLSICKLLPAKGYLYSHSVNVCVQVAAFALRSGKSHAEAITAGLAGLFHDIGMAALPLSILSSSTSLTPTEEVLVKRHPVMTCEILSAFPGLGREFFYAALEHHEHFDGSGYPAGLSGPNISYIGHVTGIASVFDAISSKRRHKRSVLPSDALAEMFKRSSKQFHPSLSESFVRMIGIYPVGTIVRLKDGYRAVVSGNVPESPLRPRIVIFMDPAGRRITPVECEMKREGVADIEKCIAPETLNVDTLSLLGFPDIKTGAVLTPPE